MDLLNLATTVKILQLFAISIKHLVFSSLVLRLYRKSNGFVFCSPFGSIRFIIEEKLVYSCSKLAFVQILMTVIKLSIMIITGQLTLIRCYTYAKRKHTKFLHKVSLALSYVVDPAIIEIWEMA